MSAEQNICKYFRQNLFVPSCRQFNSSCIRQNRSWYFTKYFLYHVDQLSCWNILANVSHDMISVRFYQTRAWLLPCLGSNSLIHWCCWDLLWLWMLNTQLVKTLLLNVGVEEKLGDSLVTAESLARAFHSFAIVCKCLSQHIICCWLV